MATTTTRWPREARADNMSKYAPLIVIELLLVFGGALAFAWWQLRDLKREREKREQARRDAARPADPPQDSRPDHAA